MVNLPTIANRYQLQREIGRGGAGVVYAVKHLHTGEKLAMKVLLSHAANQPDLVQRFRREMQASALVRSEHVVRITDADLAPELQGVPFLVMELLSGADLGRLVVERGACPAEEVLWLLGQAARGLDRAHAAGIVHRDLKPENMFLHRLDDKRLIVKLLDFGIARMIDASGLSVADARVTQDGAILGTPLFLTPEQALGEVEKIGPATDMWPVGLIAHELLTGVSYWAEEQMTTLLAKIIFKPLVPPSSKGITLGPRFDEWFLRSCAREPAQRWASVGEQIEALADALEVDRAILTATEPPPALRTWLESRPARTGEVKELSLLSISDTSVPKPRTSHASLPGVGPASREVNLITEPAPSQPHIPDARAQRRQILTTVAVYAGLSALLLTLGLLGLSRLRPNPPHEPPDQEVTAQPERSAAAIDAAAQRAAAPSPPTSTQPAVGPGELPEKVEQTPSVPGGSRRSAQGNKGSGARVHGKKHSLPRDPTAYDPSAP